MSRSLFEDYCKGIEGNISHVKNAMEKGAVLTRREDFDYLFKSYVAGKYKDAKLSRLNKDDKILAKFYAKYFLKISTWYESSYSFKNIKKVINSMLFDAYIAGISAGMYRVKYFDKDGVFYMRLMKRGKGLYEFAVNSVDSLILSATALVAYLGSEMELDSADKDFMEDFMFIEMRRLEQRVASRVYVDKRKHNLSDVSVERKKVAKYNDDQKIIKFKVS